MGAGLPFSNNINNFNSSPPPPPPAAPANHENPNDQCIVREQDRFMPIANVIRIMRKILPPHAKISDETKETIQECVSEYISFVTSEANDRCQKEQRKTITAEDVLWAMSKLGFDDYIEPLTLYLHRYREFDGAAPPHHQPLILKRPPAAGPGPGPSVFHLPPPHPHNHHQIHNPTASGSYGGGMQPHHRRHPSNGGASTSTSQATMMEPNGSHYPFHPTPKE